MKTRSIQLGIKFALLTNRNSFLAKAVHENFSANEYENATIVGILIFICRENFMLS